MADTTPAVNDDTDAVTTTPMEQDDSSVKTVTTGITPNPKHSGEVEIHVKWEMYDAIKFIGNARTQFYTARYFRRIRHYYMYDLAHGPITTN